MNSSDSPILVTGVPGRVGGVGTAIVEMLRRRGLPVRALVLHEDARRLGYGAEIAATVQEECFWRLDGPVVRAAGKNTPIPTSPALEDAAIPQLPEIIAALRRVATA